MLQLFLYDIIRNIVEIRKLQTLRNIVFYLFRIVAIFAGFRCGGQFNVTLLFCLCVQSQWNMDKIRLSQKIERSSHVCVYEDSSCAGHDAV